ncbi:MAG: copper chaperone PCu(A)C [Candidatus Rokuibacteriota bacterium]|nr:MAG: copper chaperone PCu(A)C [Candidatus Rokubacteria bacterium]
MITRRAALAALMLVATGCVHYPSVMDVGGVRLRTENGRAVREGDRARVVFDVVSTGKYGDVITGVFAPVAKEAQLVDATGAPLARYEVPGAATVKFVPDGPHVVLTGLRALTPRETFILTLQFERSGGIGVVTVVE